MANQWEKNRNKDDLHICMFCLKLEKIDSNQKININENYIMSGAKQVRVKKIQYNNFGYYLTGQLEGDGYISITNKNKIIQGITFNIKDKPLAEQIQDILGGKGFIVKRKTNSIELRFASIKTIKKIIDLINGKFRTPKIDQFYIQIDWMNKNHLSNFSKLPYNSTKLEDNSWQAGFIDANWSFQIKHTNKQIQCKFNIEQRKIYPKTQESYKSILQKICKQLDVNINIRTRQNNKNSYYIIKIENQKSVQLLINYLDSYPLNSSKYLDYIEWKKAHIQIKNKIHQTDNGKSQIKILKNNMNNSRTYFNWDHLKNIL